MATPEVSIVIANFNRDQQLKRAVESVLTQKEVEFELIIVDDASTTPPLNLYSELEKNGHHLLYSKYRQGPGPCRNWAVSAAKGKYIALLDSDDHWLPLKLSRQLQNLKENQSRIGQVEEIWIRNGRRVNPLGIHRWEAGDLFKRSLEAVCISPSSVMLERELYQEYGGFDEEFYVCEDYELWLRITAKEKISLVTDALTVKFGGHQDQLSKALPAMDRFRLLALAKNLNSSTFGERWPLARDEVLRKTEIVRKGASKRGFQKAIGLCDDITELSKINEWVSLEKSCRALCALWPVKPS